MQQVFSHAHMPPQRGFSWHADHHFEGLFAASKHKTLALRNKQRRQFTHLDIAFNWSRHVTEILDCLDPPPPATYATASFSAPVTPVPSDVPAPVINVLGSDTRRHQCDTCSCDTRVHHTITSSCFSLFGDTAIFYNLCGDSCAKSCWLISLSAPVSQAYQEQIVAGETTRNIVWTIFVIEGANRGLSCSSRDTSYFSDTCIYGCSCNTRDSD